MVIVLQCDSLSIRNKRRNKPMSLRKKGQRQTARLPVIRMYPAELETIVNAAKTAGLSLSEYVRSQLASPRVIDRIERNNSTSSHSAPHLAPHNPILTNSNHQHDLPSSPQSQSSHLSNPSASNQPHGASFVNETVARKMGHELGCTCVHCARIRAVLTPSSTSATSDRKGKRKR